MAEGFIFSIFIMRFKCIMYFFTNNILSKEFEFFLKTHIIIKLLKTSNTKNRTQRKERNLAHTSYLLPQTEFHIILGSVLCKDFYFFFGLCL